MKQTNPSTITSAYHCTNPHSSKRTGYDNIRARIAGPFTPTPSITHLSHQDETRLLNLVIQPAPFTVPSMTLASNFHSPSPNPRMPRRTPANFTRPVTN